MKVTPQRSRPYPGRFGDTLCRALAVLLLILPLADVHSETSLTPVAPGSLVASAALHPGAAKHFESSATTTAPRCPACDLAQQTAAALVRTSHFAPLLPQAPVAALKLPLRPAAALAPAASRGPPSS